MKLTYDIFTSREDAADWNSAGTRDTFAEATRFAKALTYAWPMVRVIDSQNHIVYFQWHRTIAHIAKADRMVRELSRPKTAVPEVSLTAVSSKATRTHAHDR